jgi:hypothetical protein
LAVLRIPDLPSPGDAVRFRAGFGQRFLVTVDTEEEFDWSAPLRREGHGVVAVDRLARFQAFCEGNGVVPLYLLDHPVATAPAAAEALRTAVARGRAEIGVHLHPWLSPPHDETVNPANSFAGNLPEALEREKLHRLRDTIERAFGVVPLIYRAGRYGAGRNTARILTDQGIAIDSSVRPLFDYRAEGGPDYRHHPQFPYWIDRASGLFELPLTTAVTGRLRKHGAALLPRLARVPRLTGAFARAGLLERIPLSPEGITRAEALRGTEAAIDAGLPVLVYSFHSPSLAAGHTPYVRTGNDLDRFYDWWRAILAHLAKRGVAPTSIAEILAAIER